MVLAERYLASKRLAIRLAAWSSRFSGLARDVKQMEATEKKTASNRSTLAGTVIPISIASWFVQDCPVVAQRGTRTRKEPDPANALN
jgi:hypothetical protein